MPKQVSSSLLTRFTHSLVCGVYHMESRVATNSINLTRDTDDMLTTAYFRLLRVYTAGQGDPMPKVSFINNEPEFRWALLADQMSFEKLHEGIRKFAEDGESLKALLREKLRQ